MAVSCHHYNSRYVDVNLAILAQYVWLVCHCAVMLFNAINARNTHKLHQRNHQRRQCQLIHCGCCFKLNRPRPCRAVSDIISSSVLTGERRGHAGAELAIYTELKCFFKLILVTIDINDGYATIVLTVHLFSHIYPTPCLPLACFESINAGNNVGGSFDVACGCCRRCQPGVK